MSKNNFSIRFFLVLVLFLSTCVNLLFSQENTTDTIQTYNLREVEVHGQKLRTTRSVVPLQILSQKEFLKINAINIADVVGSFSGVTLKDYGGIGGMKTVSVRGMDSRYTSVSYDGVMLSNIQNGQIDLGAFPIDNVAEISLSNAHPTDYLQSARLFSNGSVLNIKTLLPNEKLGRRVGGKAYVKIGSFGYINPGLLVLKNVGEKSGVSFSSDLITAHGRYPFLQNYGVSSKDSTALLHRKNTDVQLLRSEFNYAYRPSYKETFLFKTNLHISERGLPGSITFYNEQASRERIKENSIFTQLQYSNRNWNKLQYNFIARHHYSSNHYTDRNNKYSQTDGLLSHKFMQHEYYISASAASNIHENFVMSGAFDTWLNVLNVASNNNNDNFIYPKRYTSMANIAAKYFTNQLTIGANLLYTGTIETKVEGDAAPNRKKLSPTISIAFQPWEDKEFRVRAFYKNLYRLPTFNELYYQELGNKNLLPENANMVNLGITLSENNVADFLDITFSADAYYNKVKDKIVMIPKNGFFWTMLNKGKVNILGVDANLTAAYTINESSKITLRSNYSFQHAKDVTPDSENYGEQIPYMPLHSGSSSISYTLRNWEMGYNFVFSGVRWIGQMTEKRNKMNPYTIHSGFLQTHYKNWQIKTEVINLLNTQYEIVKFYPMPRRNYRLSLIYNL